MNLSRESNPVREAGGNHNYGILSKAVMKFLDYYGVRIYRRWSEMPLPLRILSSDQWISKIEKYGLSFKEKVNMGFANNKYTSCLQRCNLALVFECVSGMGKGKVGNSVDEDNDVTG